MKEFNKMKETMSYNDQLLQENRRLIEHLFKIQEEEGRIFEHVLQDKVAQWLTAIYLETEVIANNVDKESSIYASVQTISECTIRTLELIRKLLHQLRPTLLDTLGLVDALHGLRNQWILENTDVNLEYRLEGELEKFDEFINITVYRIVQGALYNICSHAQASQFLVYLGREPELGAEGNTLLLHMEGNGTVYNHALIELELLRIRERAIVAGGKFAVLRGGNDGMQIYVRLPLGR